MSDLPPDANSDAEAERQKMRSRVKWEFRGAGQPLDLERHVSKAGDWVESILEAIGVKGGLEEERVKETWRSLVGEVVASQTEPVSLRKGCLTLQVLQPSMRYHLEQLKGELLRKLQRELGEEQVKSVRLVIG